jgi:hypothetical protein
MKQGLVGLMSWAILASSASLAQVRPPTAPPVVPPAQPGSGVLEPLEPPDGVWMIEKETGREYFEEAHYKDGEAGFRRMPDGTIRLRWGLTIKPVREDADFFYVRVYRPQEVERPSNSRIATGEDLERIAKKYVGTAGASDQWELEVLTRSLPAADQWRNGFELVDFDGDGNLDIAHGPVRTGAGLPVFLFGDGEGNFQGRRVTYDLTSRLDYGDVGIADFDGDGLLDAAYACHLMGAMVLRNLGNDRFAPWSRGIEFNVPGRGGAGESFSSRALAVGDMNNDGRPDVVVLGEGPKLMGQIANRSAGAGDRPPGADGSYGARIYLNNGDGTWSFGDPVLPKLAGDHVLVHDLDGNGRLDIIIATIMVAHTPFVALQQADGTFTELELPFENAGLVKGLAIVDLDGNGRPDLALTRQVRELDGWHGTLEIVWDVGFAERRRELLSGDLTLIASLAAGDFDADGVMDLVAGGGNGRIILLRGSKDEKGSMRFDVEESPEVGTMPYPGCISYHVAAGPVDKVPGDDIIATFASDRCNGNGRIEGWRVKRKVQPEASTEAAASATSGAPSAQAPATPEP